MADCDRVWRRSPHVHTALGTLYRTMEEAMRAILAAAIAGTAFGALAQPLIDPSRTTTWNPGLNAVGGIPNRTAISATLSPLGGVADDTPQIQAALDSCPAGQVVKLNPGTFNINGPGLSFTTSNCTLRGSGTGSPAPTNQAAPCSGSGAGGTRLVKADRDTNTNFAILYLGFDPSVFSS